MTIVSVLLATLMPVLRSVRGRMHSLKCISNLRTVSLQFQLFAEGLTAAGRGDSERLGRGFFINDFQDSLYRIDEFWDVEGTSVSALDRDSEPTVCPATAGAIQKRRGFPCGRQSVGPVENVSLAVNKRLHQPVVMVAGRPRLAPEWTVRVRPHVLNRPYVPLAMDVNAAAAVARGLDPFYIAPPRLTGDDPYSGFWNPGSRHARKTNVAFVGGHVLTSDRPEREPWDWDYQAQVGNGS